mgnify:CR=1 FL=1
MTESANKIRIAGRFDWRSMKGAYDDEEAISGRVQTVAGFDD